MKKAKILTKYEIAAMIGWYRQSDDYTIVGLLAGVTTCYARCVVEDYLEKKRGKVETEPLH